MSYLLLNNAKFAKAVNLLIALQRHDGKPIGRDAAIARVQREWDQAYDTDMVVAVLERAAELRGIGDAESGKEAQLPK